MGRKERRTLERMSAIDEKLRDLERCRECKKNYDEAMDDVRTFTIHHITGEAYTALALALRRHPYRWSKEKVMRLLAEVGSIVNDLNEGTIHDSDLVAEGEKYGIRVLWDGGHKWIDAIDIFEEESK